MFAPGTGPGRRFISLFHTPYRAKLVTSVKFHVRGALVTDEEIAIAIGERILSLQRGKYVLEVILDQLRQGPNLDPVAWRELRQSDEQRLAVTQIAQDECEELRRAIRLQSPASALEKLHRYLQQYES